MSTIPLTEKWNELYRSATVGTPARVLLDNTHLLPTHGAALEIACGLGANALLLATQGLQVEAWDASPVAIEKLVAHATAHRLPVSGRACDVMVTPINTNAYDVIVVSHFLERELMPRLLAALRPNGLLFYQTFTIARVDDSGPRNPAFRLEDNELLQLCAPLRVLVYREEGAVGDGTRGFRNLATYIGQKRGIN